MIKKKFHFTVLELNKNRLSSFFTILSCGNDNNYKCLRRRNCVFSIQTNCTWARSFYFFFKQICYFIIVILRLQLNYLMVLVLLLLL